VIPAISQSPVSTHCRVIPVGFGRSLAPMVKCPLSEDQTIRLWNARNGTCLTVLRVIRVGSLSALVPMDRFWPVPATTPQSDCGVLLTAPPSKHCHTRWVWAVAFSPMVKPSPAGEDCTIRLWEVRHTCRKTLQGILVGSPHSASVPMVIASGSEDASVRLWSVQDGTCFKRLQGYSCVWIFAFNSRWSNLSER